MFKDNLIFQFLTVITVVLAVVFVAHIGVLHLYELPLFADKIVLSYLVNYVMAAAIFIILYKLRHKLKTQIGFLFMFGSALKFLVFFIVFHPIYTADGNITKHEFFAFFLPYGISLVLETYFAAQMLKKME